MTISNILLITYSVVYNIIDCFIADTLTRIHRQIYIYMSMNDMEIMHEWDLTKTMYSVGMIGEIECKIIRTSIEQCIA